MSDRRAATRIKIRHLSFVRPNLQTAEILNVSKTGIALVSHDSLPDRGTIQLTCPGLSIEVEFELVHQEAKDEQFEARARLNVAASQESRFQRYLRYLERVTA